MKHTLIYGGVLPDLPLRLVHSKREARKVALKLKDAKAADAIEEASGHACASVLRFPKTGMPLFLVCLDTDEQDERKIHALFAHEAVHVALAYFESFGEDEPGEEEMAYTVQAVTDVLIEDHEEWRKKHAQ